MKQIYIILFFLLPLSTFSQLHIQPYQNSDSFIYVEGDLLFVEGGIHMTINPSEDKKASIYLRDEAQLLQGTAGTHNTGNGLLSVFQEGEATAFTYNYWSLPVQNPHGPQSPGGVLHEPLDRTNSRKAVITPELNGSSNPLRISGRWIYKLSGRDYFDWVPINEVFDLSPGEGFTMKGVQGSNMETIIHGVYNNPGNKQRYDFRGKPNTGDIALPIQKEQIFLTGNPYPSSLDLDAFLQENYDITGIAYFWDSRPVASHYLTDYEGGYGAFSPGAGSNGYVPAAFSKYDREGNSDQQNQGRGNHYARKHSPIAQGFIVEGKRDGQIFFKNKYREFIKENPGSSQFKSSGGRTGLVKEISLLRLNVEFSNTFVRQLLFYHHPLATGEADHAMDAKNIMPLPSDAGWQIQNVEYLISADQISIDSKFPLVFHLENDQELKVILEEVNNIDSSVYLFDKNLNTYHPLKEKPFIIQLQEGNYSGRFFLTFQTEAEAKEYIEIEVMQIPLPINQYTIFQNNQFNRLEVYSPLLETPQKVELYDITGRKLREQKGEKERAYYEFYTRNLSRGIYIVKITGPEGTIVSKKVLISN